MRSKDTFFSSKASINCGGRLLSFEHPLVMGILNITPDSFFSGSRKMLVHEVKNLAGQMLGEGASILDIGAVSTRPGSKPVSGKVELERLAPVLESLRSSFPDVILSVDTYRADVARKVVAEYSVDIINDISGGSLDERMFDTIAELQVPYILMHMRGTPENMQQHTSYDNLLIEIRKYFSQRIKTLQELGVNDIIIDPGFGFAKTRDQNFELLSSLESFLVFGKPVLAGISRKSMIYKTLGVSASEALTGSTALHAVALLKGASLLRVHDVREAVEVVRLIEKMHPAS